MASSIIDQQRKSERLWAALVIQPVPSLHHLGSVDRDRFELLDLYLRDCLEEWRTNAGALSAHSIVLLDECMRTLTQRFTLLDGEAQHYFGQFKRLARRILRGVNVEQAANLASLERAADPDLAPFFGELSLVLEEAITHVTTIGPRPSHHA